MNSPFTNDPFSLVSKAFSNIYPDKQYIAYWNPSAREFEEHDYGYTNFPIDGSIPEIWVNTMLSVENAVEIFAHELAHIATKGDATHIKHGKEWEDAFENIHKEYNRLIEEKII